MIRTLKITTFVAAVVCLVLIITVAAFGLRGDTDIEKALAAPSVIDGLRKVLESAPNAGDQVSPLVLQAKGFALRINPPPPPPPPVTPKTVVPGSVPVARAVEPPVVPEKKAEVKSIGKFDVVATCRYDDQPGKSMALLNLPGKGLKWYSVGENVEHLVLAAVNDGSVVMAQPAGAESRVDMKVEPSIIKSILARDSEPVATAEGVGVPDSGIWSPPPPAVTVKKGSAYVPPKPGTTRTYSPPTGRTIPSASRIPGAYVATGSRTRTPPPEPTVAQRKAALDDNIGDIKKIMEVTAGEGSAQAKEEQDALMRLLQLLESERKAAEEEGKGAGVPGAAADGR